MPTELYEVLDAEAPERRTMRKLATRPLLYAAMEKYFERRFKAAQDEFAHVSSQDPDDVIPILFAERCARYVHEPPPQDWRLELTTEK